MKIPALMTCLLAMLLAAVPLQRASADEVNFDVFYNSLADDGDWYNTPEYGYVWQPFVAYKTDKWRPYSDGYWAQTEDGWTWVSYENFGWATYHYGRWTRLKDTGWVWVPGYDWGPGWVSWRTNDDYVGWAPLPPKAEEGVYEGSIVDSHRSEAEQLNYNDVEQADAGYGTNVDVQYDIGPANYCFVETRNFGAPVLSEVVLPPQQNFVFIERTRNVTNIYYRRERDQTIVYNNGPDFGFIDSHVSRPIPRLQLERRDDPAYLRDGLRGGGNPTLVRNGVLQVASPQITRGPINFTQVKPARIKQNLTQSQVVRGWSNSGADQATVQRIRSQYKQQAAAAPARPASPVIPQGIPARQQRTEREAGNTPPAPNGAQPFASRQAAQATGTPHAPLTEADRIARRDARQKEREQRASGQSAPAASAPAAAQQPNAEPDKEARRAARQAARANGQPAPAANTPDPAATRGETDPDKEARRAARQAARANGQPAQPSENAQSQPSNGRTEEERATRQDTRQPQQPPAKPTESQASSQADQEREARRAARQQERASQPAVPQAQQEQDARREARQQERAAQPERPAQPQSQIASPARETRQEQPRQGGKPGQSPAP